MDYNLGIQKPRSFREMMGIQEKKQKAKPRPKTKSVEQKYKFVYLDAIPATRLRKTKRVKRRAVSRKKSNGLSLKNIFGKKKSQKQIYLERKAAIDKALEEQRYARKAQQIKEAQRNLAKAKARERISKIKGFLKR